MKKRIKNKLFFQILFKYPKYIRDIVKFELSFDTLLEHELFSILKIISELNIETITPSLIISIGEEYLKRRIEEEEIKELFSEDLNLNEEAIKVLLEEKLEEFFLKNLKERITNNSLSIKDLNNISKPKIIEDEIISLKEIDKRLKLYTNYGELLEEKGIEFFLPSIRNLAFTSYDGKIPIGWLCVVVAPFRVGKTVFLCNVGANAIQEGKKVIHITLELYQAEVWKRYDSILFKIPISLPFSMLKDNAEYKKMQEIMLETVKGDLLVAYFPQEEITVADLKNKIEEYLNRLGWNSFDVLIVDYLNYLLPNRYYREKRDRLSSITSDLRNLAKELNVVLWTATQVNRAGATMLEKKKGNVLKASYIAECWEIAWKSDFIIGLYKPIELEEFVKNEVVSVRNLIVLPSRGIPEIDGIFQVGIKKDTLEIIELKEEFEELPDVIF